MLDEYSPEELPILSISDILNLFKNAQSQSGEEENHTLFILSVGLVLLLCAFLGSEILSFLLNGQYSLSLLLVSLLLLTITLLLSQSIMKKRWIPLASVLIPLMFLLLNTFLFFFSEKTLFAIIGSVFLPVTATLSLGHRKGLILSLCGGFLFYYFVYVNDSASVSEVAGLYIAVTLLSFLVGGLRSSLGKADSDSCEILSESTGSKEKSLSSLYSYMSEKKGDMFILYRKDVLRTLQKIPQPQAVLSYLMLEGLGDVNFFSPEGKGDIKYGDLEDMENYYFTSCSVDDYFSRVEAVLEFRNAKKSLEFNKVQNQINRVFSGAEENESEEAGLATMFEKYNITDREIDIATCILKGLTNKEISQELYISIETVKSHVKNILKKCCISSRIELIKLFSK